jgi:putative thioredoxin
VTTHGAFVRDVTDAEFEQAVIRRSFDVPVVVDFWAPWCGPCRQLGPTLERLAGEAGGAWELVKLNTDENPRTSMQYRIQSIPAVKAFRDGQMVDEFIGALPEPQVRAFVSRLLPSAADLKAREGDELAAMGYATTAEDRYDEALALDPNHARAILGKAESLAGRGAVADALALLDRRPGDREAQALRARLGLQQAGGDADLDTLVARVAVDPKDAAARYDLGRALAARGDYADAMDHLLEVVRLDRTLDNDGARRALLDIFSLLGDEDQRTQTYRRRLGMLLF